MAYVSIPFLSSSEQAEPLRRCIEAAASKTAVTQYTATIVMSHFLEQLAAEVAKGRVVRVPGFGTFAPWLIENPASVARWGGGRSKPVFSPSRGFREEVHLAAPHNPDAKRAINRHRRNHALGSGGDRSRDRVFTAMEAMRQNISAQMAVGRKNG